MLKVKLRSNLSRALSCHSLSHGQRLFFFSLKRFQEQLQSAGSDVSAQLQQNFDAQVAALKAEHQVSPEDLKY